MVSILFVAKFKDVMGSYSDPLGGITLFLIDRAVMIVSKLPDAPKVCPITPLLEVTTGFLGKI